MRLAALASLADCIAFKSVREIVEPPRRKRLDTKYPALVAHCQCGAVELSAWGRPITVNACYCDDCQAAARRLAASADSGRASRVNDGMEFMVFRRDRIACTRGANRLQAMRLTGSSKTRRMIASCCATPMYMAFDDKRPRVSAFRAPFGADAPPVQMRICTRSKRSTKKVEAGVPSHPGYPLAMMIRILAAWPIMMFAGRSALYRSAIVQCHCMRQWPYWEML